MAWAAPDKDLSKLLDGQSHVLRLAATTRGTSKFSNETPPRVSLKDYEENLRRMTELVTEAGGTAVLLTAPTTWTPDHPVMKILTEETHDFYDPLPGSLYWAYTRIPAKYFTVKTQKA